MGRRWHYPRRIRGPGADISQSVARAVPAPPAYSLVEAEEDRSEGHLGDRTPPTSPTQARGTYVRPGRRARPMWSSTRGPFRRAGQQVRRFPRITLPGESGGRGFGSSALRAEDSISAMLSYRRLVVKLREDRVAGLVGSGVGRPLDAERAGRWRNGSPWSPLMTKPGGRPVTTTDQWRPNGLRTPVPRWDSFVR
jgi:hypothetical protein